MIKIVKYDPEHVYMLGNGEYGHEAILKHFPGVEQFPHLVETDESETMAYAIQLIPAMRSFYNIDPALSETDALAAIETIRNAPQPEPEPDQQTVALAAIAAQLEYQNMLTFDDTEVV